MSEPSGGHGPRRPSAGQPRSSAEMAIRLRGLRRGQSAANVGALFAFGATLATSLPAYLSGTTRQSLAAGILTAAGVLCMLLWRYRRTRRTLCGPRRRGDRRLAGGVLLLAAAQVVLVFLFQPDLALVQPWVVPVWAGCAYGEFIESRLLRLLQVPEGQSLTEALQPYLDESEKDET